MEEIQALLAERRIQVQEETKLFMGAAESTPASVEDNLYKHRVEQDKCSCSSEAERMPRGGVSSFESSVPEVTSVACSEGTDAANGRLGIKELDTVARASTIAGEGCGNSARTDDVIGERVMPLLLESEEITERLVHGLNNLAGTCGVEEESCKANAASETMELHCIKETGRRRRVYSRLELESLCPPPDSSMQIATWKKVEVEAAAILQELSEAVERTRPVSTGRQNTRNKRRNKHFSETVAADSSITMQTESIPAVQDANSRNGASTFPSERSNISEMPASSLEPACSRNVGPALVSEGADEAQIRNVHSKTKDSERGNCLADQQQSEFSAWDAKPSEVGGRWDASCMDTHLQHEETKGRNDFAYSHSAFEAAITTPAEDDSDEEETFQHAALAVYGEPDFASGPPEDGLEFLRRVRYERDRCAKVVVAAINPDVVARQTPYVPKIASVAACSAVLLPAAAWKASFLKDFSALRARMEDLFSSDAAAPIISEFLPPARNAAAWHRLCFGDAHPLDNEEGEGRQEPEPAAEADVGEVDPLASMAASSSDTEVREVGTCSDLGGGDEGKVPTADFLASMKTTATSAECSHAETVYFAADSESSSIFNDSLIAPSLKGTPGRSTNSEDEGLPVEHRQEEAVKEQQCLPLSASLSSCAVEGTFLEALQGAPPMASALAVSSAANELPLLPVQGAPPGSCNGTTSEAAGESQHRLLEPYLHLLFPLDTVSCALLLCHHARWLQTLSSISKDRALWLFALCAIVDIPIDADTGAALRSVLRKCAEIRAGLPLQCPQEDPQLPLLNVLITIAGGYFGQADPADLSVKG
eukprot:TRINITY_DN10454_c0_g1_i1.p1 TRINITY_DN10454_c0_g1~~TRINITY_DN10454_c0_g1_i1.p1  ORF type:complete len:823 (+),score=111.03 TRINITY_DN10454_c0_g1_i1:214-2682(+)